MAKTPKKKLASRGAAEFRFKIEAYTPQTMPMQRLAEYLRELAQVLGDTRDVHLVRIEEGSTVPVFQVAYEAIPKVQERAVSVRRGDAPRDPVMAYRRINQMLREDNGRAVFQRGVKGARILEFPGRDEAEETFSNIKQFGAIEAIVSRVGGHGETIPVLLESEGKTLAGCWANRQLAKEIAKYLFEPIRVVGKGVWARDKEGEWSLTSFHIEAFDRLDPAPLSEAVVKLRAINADFGPDPIGDVLRLRHGSGH